jgi:lambda repressor-like predicted transcriptional regulator
MLNDIVITNLKNEQFSFNDLAREAGLNHSTLHRKLKKIPNQPVSHFIREVQLIESSSVFLLVL